MDDQTKVQQPGLGGDGSAPTHAKKCLCGGLNPFNPPLHCYLGPWGPTLLVSKGWGGLCKPCHGESPSTCAAPTMGAASMSTLSFFLFHPTPADLVLPVPLEPHISHREVCLPQMSWFPKAQAEKPAKPREQLMVPMGQLQLSMSKLGTRCSWLRAEQTCVFTPC